MFMFGKTIGVIFAVYWVACCIDAQQYNYDNYDNYGRGRVLRTFQKPKIYRTWYPIDYANRLMTNQQDEGVKVNRRKIYGIPPIGVRHTDTERRALFAPPSPCSNCNSELLNRIEKGFNLVVNKISKLQQNIEALNGKFTNLENISDRSSDDTLTGLTQPIAVVIQDEVENVEKETNLKINNRKAKKLVEEEEDEDDPNCDDDDDNNNSDQCEAEDIKKITSQIPRKVNYRKVIDFDEDEKEKPKKTKQTKETKPTKDNAELVDDLEEVIDEMEGHKGIGLRKSNFQKRKQLVVSTTPSTIVTSTSTPGSDTTESVEGQEAAVNALKDIIKEMERDDATTPSSEPAEFGIDAAKLPKI